MKQLQLTAPAPSSASASKSDEVVQPLKIKAPVRENPDMIELDDEMSGLSRPATAAEEKLWAKKTSLPRVQSSNGTA